MNSERKDDFQRAVLNIKSSTNNSFEQNCLHMGSSLVYNKHISHLKKNHMYITNIKSNVQGMCREANDVTLDTTRYSIPKKHSQSCLANVPVP